MDLTVSNEVAFSPFSPSTRALRGVAIDMKPRLASLSRRPEPRRMNLTDAQQLRVIAPLLHTTPAAAAGIHIALRMRRDEYLLLTASLLASLNAGRLSDLHVSHAHPRSPRDSPAWMPSTCPSSLASATTLGSIREHFIQLELELEDVWTYLAMLKLSCLVHTPEHDLPNTRP